MISYSREDKISYQEGEALARQARHLIPGGAASLSAEVTPVIGTHIGPGAVGFIAIQARSSKREGEQK